MGQWKEASEPSPCPHLTADQGILFLSPLFASCCAVSDRTSLAVMSHHQPAIASCPAYASRAGEHS